MRNLHYSQNSCVAIQQHTCEERQLAVALLEIPAAQCTSTQPPPLKAWVIKEEASSRCGTKFAWSASSRLIWRRTYFAARNLLKSGQSCRTLRLGRTVCIIDTRCGGLRLILKHVKHHTASHKVCNANLLHLMQGLESAKGKDLHHTQAHGSLTPADGAGIRQHRHRSSDQVQVPGRTNVTTCGIL